MFRILDRYLIRGFIAPFLLSLLVFTFILVMPLVVEMAEKLIAKGVPAATVGWLMVTLLPQALALTIPISLLLAILIGLSRVSGDREWVAMQACGVSAYRLMGPVLLVGILGWAATSWVIIWAVPEANQVFRETRFQIMVQRAEGEIKPRVFFEDFPNRIVYVRDVPPNGTGWRDVFIADSSQPENLVVFLSRSGRLLLDRQKRTVELFLQDGTQHVTGAAVEDYRVQEFAEMRLSLDPEFVFPRRGIQKGDREMTIAELQASIAESQGLGSSTHNAIMEIHKKFSIPLACLVFAVLALAFGLTTRRDGKLASFVLGIGVIFVYYVFMWTSQSAAKGALIPPWLAMWIPNIVLGAAGVMLLLARGPWAGRLVASAAAVGRRVGQSGLWSAAWRLARRSPSPAVAGRRPIPAGGTARPWLPRPSILDGYLTRQYVRVMALAFVAMMGIFYISTFIDLSDELFKGKTTLAMLLRFLYYSTPQFAYYCLPISVLLGTLVTIGLLTRNSELIVMRACGISLYRTALPLVLVAVAASGVLFVFEENVLAYSNRRAEALRHVIRGGSPRTFDVMERKWIVGRGGEIYNYVYFDPGRSELNRFSVFHFEPKSARMDRRAFYRQMTYVGPTVGGDGKGLWNASEGWVRQFGRKAKEGTFATVPAAQERLEPPDFFVTEQPEGTRMNYHQLKAYVETLSAGGFNVTPSVVELHRKLSFPWVTVVMTLLAVPFAATTGRRGAMYGIGLGVVLSLTYWLMTSFFVAIGGAGIVTPVLAAWAPNILFAAAAAYMLLTVRT